MAAPQASSRLELLQARFQQKRLQEKEQKLLQLYDQQQQRAHQVAQRGSAGSNDSAHTGMMNQQSVTRNSSTINSNATSQGGKVRQMFDERRQTNIKGIDKSYPLEPLDNNKPKKHVVQSKHGNAANRQRVVMRRVARADINSNVNGGKSVVSYHENGKEDYANENETTFINGHLRNGNRHELNAGELIADDALDRNRMLAKLHTMDFDKSGKHRSSNDLDAEQFPEELEVDVPDKVPRKPTTKKLSPAEARLERFKNANTKKASATITKKRSEPTTPTGNSRGSPITKSRKIDKDANKTHRNITKSENRNPKKKVSDRNVDRLNNGPETDTKSEKKNFFADDCDVWKSTILVREIIRSHSRDQDSENSYKINETEFTTEWKSDRTSPFSESPVPININESADRSKIYKSETVSKTKPSQTLKRTNSQDKSTYPFRKNSRIRPALSESFVSKSVHSRRTSTPEEMSRSDQVFDGSKMTDYVRTRAKQINSCISPSFELRAPSVECPTDYQEITVIDQFIEANQRYGDDIENLDPARSPSPWIRMQRRSSFEKKRMMFEQMREPNFRRSDSEESALRHFDSIGTDTDPQESSIIDETINCLKPVSVPEPSVIKQESLPDDRIKTKKTTERDTSTKPWRVNRKSTLGVTETPKQRSKPFNRSTSLNSNTSKSSSTKLCRRKETVSTPSNTEVPKSSRISKKTKFSEKKFGEKKIADARNSVELTRNFMRNRSPSCKRKIVFEKRSSRKLEEESADEVQDVRKKSEVTFLTVSYDDIDTSVVPSENETKKAPEKKSVKTRQMTNRNSSRSMQKSCSNDNNSANESSKRSNRFLNSPKTPSPTTSPKRVTNGDSKNSSPRKSAPSSPSKSPELQTKQSSPTTGQRPPSSQSNASSGGSNRSQPSTEVKSGMATKAKSKASKKAPPVKVATPVTPPKPPVPPSCDSIGNLVACSMCGRKFADDRITLHEEICQRTGHKRRKQFDAMTHRVKGTELEPFVKHGLPPKEKSQRPDVRSSNWRRKHEDFINAIRSAKQVKAHLAAGGKLSDLPPPPPSDTSDYIQCPHCGRKFNQGAAERHIPKCQHMLHNKPNPRAPPKPKR